MNKQRRKYNKIEKKENELKPIQKPIFSTNHINLKNNIATVSFFSSLTSDLKHVQKSVYSIESSSQHLTLSISKIIVSTNDKYIQQSIQQHDSTCLILVQLFLNTTSLQGTDINNSGAIMYVATFLSLRVGNENIFNSYWLFFLSKTRMYNSDFH